MTINPNSGQLIAIKHPPSPLMIIAGAGTGKTFTLQNRITYFIEKRKIKPENILAITYTEKASYELKNRIIKNKYFLKLPCKKSRKKIKFLFLFD